MEEEGERYEKVASFKREEKKGKTAGACIIVEKKMSAGYPIFIFCCYYCVVCVDQLKSRIFILNFFWVPRESKRKMCGTNAMDALFGSHPSHRSSPFFFLC